MKNNSTSLFLALAFLFLLTVIVLYKKKEGFANPAGRVVRRAGITVAKGFGDRYVHAGKQGVRGTVNVLTAFGNLIQR
jgi:hypothetical protein